MFERFSEQARLAVVNALRLTDRQSSQEVCTRHFLWALLIDGSEVPKKISQESTNNVLQILGPMPEQDGDLSVLLPLSNSSKRLLERGYDLAITDGREMVDEWDLLIAAMWETSGSLWLTLHDALEASTPAGSTSEMQP